MTLVLREPSGRTRKAKLVNGKLRREYYSTLNKNLVSAGIDGEGVTDERGIHRYVLLQWADKTRAHHGELVNATGIGTFEALEFLLSIPQTVRTFAFAFNYDLTCILRDLPDGLLAKLFRPELRKRLPGRPGLPVPVKWKGFSLNLVGTRFSVRRKNRSRVIWDIFRFYGKKFTACLKDWKICEESEIKRIEDMKDKRESFHAGMLGEMSEYCYRECAYLGEMAEKLVKAHSDAGLELKNFYGAGSTAAALILRMGIKTCRRDAGDKQKEMTHAVASAFFGGRFENSVVGLIEGPLYSYDICSAYPYQLRFLPCLEHGKWEYSHERRSIDTARAALVSYCLPQTDCMANRAWGPFPFRVDRGSVVFPASSGGGWVWRDEYLIGERLFPNVVFEGAWVLNSDCDCSPFAEIPSIYLQRLMLGKDGAGIILKLGPNSVYGKLAQSIGNPQFQSWIWAAITTSGARAQLLDMLSLSSDWSNILAFATDSVVSRVPITVPIPRDTGTSVLLDGTPNNPNKLLGAWDGKVEQRSVFLARPGIYFPLGPTEQDLEHIRARGIGRKNLLRCGSRLIEAWDRGQIDDIDLGTIRRFCGAKTSTHAPSAKHNEWSRAPYYGQWVDRPVIASLNPKPKRESEIDRHGSYGSLRLRSFPNLRSEPYKRALTNEALSLKSFTDQSYEQPEGMFDVQHDFEVEQEA